MKNVSNYVAACMMMALPFTGMAQQNADRYVKHVVFPEGATLDEKVSMAARLVPTPQQLEWQKMEAMELKIRNYLILQIWMRTNGYVR